MWDIANRIIKNFSRRQNNTLLYTRRQMRQKCNEVRCNKHDGVGLFDVRSYPQAHSLTATVRKTKLLRHDILQPKT